jgi:hypothetical protein
MEKYIVEATEFTPEIIFNPDNWQLSFKGVSRPEDVMKFYMPAINWLKLLDENIQTHTNEKYNIAIIHLIFHFSYFNSSSSKMLLQIIEIIKKIQRDGIDITVDWYYDETDEQMYDDGQDLAEAVDIPFNYHPV